MANNETAPPSLQLSLPISHEILRLIAEIHAANIISDSHAPERGLRGQKILQPRIMFESAASEIGLDGSGRHDEFYVLVPIENRLFSYTLLHTFSTKVTNETRLAYRRSVDRRPVREGLSFPGLDAFPNIGLLDLAVDIGPNPNFPQNDSENNYQLVNNTTWLLGAHSLKFGVDFRNILESAELVDLRHQLVVNGAQGGFWPGV